MENPDFTICIKQPSYFPTCPDPGYEAEIKNCKTGKMRCLFSTDYKELFLGITKVIENAKAS